jgi:exportin-1
MYDCFSRTGPAAARTHIVKSMRSVKAETLKLIETWVDRAEHTDIIVRDILPPLLAAVLHDYRYSSSALSFQQFVDHSII